MCYFCNWNIRTAPFGRSTPGANIVPSKLFLAFLFSDPDVGVQFLKDVGYNSKKYGVL